MLTRRYWFRHPISSQNMFDIISRRIAKAKWTAKARVGDSYVDVVANNNTHEMIKQFVDAIVSREYEIETID